MAGHIINRVTILGTGLIGGSFALALRKHTTGIHISGWDRPKVVSDAHARDALDAPFYGELGPALENADLIYIALPISVALDLLPEIARLAPSHALVTDACSTKLRIGQTAANLFPGENGPIFLGGHPMAGRELAGIASATPDLFRDAPYAVISEPQPEGEAALGPRESHEREMSLVQSAHRGDEADGLSGRARAGDRLAQRSERRRRDQ